MPKCELCGHTYVMITHSHLKLYHNITLEDYKRQFPGVLMRDENYCNEESRSRGVSKAYWSKSEEEREKFSRVLSRTHQHQTPSEEAKKQISKSMRKVWEDPIYRETVSNTHKGNWKNPEYRKKVVDSLRRRPTSPERHITYILNKYFPEKWVYVGDKGPKPKIRQPDWSHAYLKKVICYDEYFWHTLVRDDKPSIKINYFANLGYDCLVLTNEDLLEIETLPDRIKKFMDKEELNK